MVDSNEMEAKKQIAQEIRRKILAYRLGTCLKKGIAVSLPLIRA
jgi:hypothetical protein